MTLAESTVKKINGVTQAPRRYNDTKSISRTSFPRKEGANYVATSKNESEIHRLLKCSLNGLKTNEWLGIDSPEEVHGFMKDFNPTRVGLF